MMTFTHLGLMAVAGVAVGEVIVRLRQRLAGIIDSDVTYPGATLKALVVGGCGASPRALATRITTAAIWLVSAAAISAPASAVAFACLLSLLLAGALVDAAIRILPDEVTGALVWGGIAAHLFGVVPWAASLEGALVGVVVTYAALWLLSAGFCVSRDVTAIGHGDLKLAAGLGAWLTIGALPLTLAVAFSAQVLAHLVLRRGQLAFGPALAIAGAVIAALKVVGVDLSPLAF